MNANLKFFLRSNPDRSTAERIVTCVNDHGHGSATLGSEGGFAVLYVEDRRDFDLVKAEFGHLLDAWMATG